MQRAAKAHCVTLQFLSPSSIIFDVETLVKKYRDRAPAYLISVKQTLLSVKPLPNPGRRWLLQDGIHIGRPFRYAPMGAGTAASECRYAGAGLPVSRLPSDLTMTG